MEKEYNYYYHLIDVVLMNVEVELTDVSSVRVTWNASNIPRLPVYTINGFVVYYRQVGSEQGERGEERSLVVPSSDNMAEVKRLEFDIMYHIQVAVAFNFSGEVVVGGRSEPLTVTYGDREAEDDLVIHLLGGFGVVAFVYTAILLILVYIIMRYKRYIYSLTACLLLASAANTHTYDVTMEILKYL